MEVEVFGFDQDVFFEDVYQVVWFYLVQCFLYGGEDVVVFVYVVDFLDCELYLVWVVVFEFFGDCQSFFVVVVVYGDENLDFVVYDVGQFLQVGGGEFGLVLQGNDYVVYYWVVFQKGSQFLVYYLMVCWIFFFREMNLFVLIFRGFSVFVLDCMIVLGILLGFIGR